MRKEIVVLIICAVALITLGARAQVGAIDSDRSLRRHDYEHEHDYEKEAKKYTCLMHPEIVMDHPGNCPKCGMKLVPIKESKHSTPNSDESRAGAQRSTLNPQSHEM